MISASFHLENRFDAPITPHLQAESAPKFRTGSLDFKMHKMFSHDTYVWLFLKRLSVFISV